MQHDLFTFGETMALLTSDAGQPFDPAAPFYFRFGGADSNVAIVAARLGVRTSWYSRLGQDPLGWWIRREVTAQGVDTEAVAMDADRVTGLMLKARVDEASAKVYYYRRYSAASALDPDTFPFEAVANARWLHATGITPALSASARQAWTQALAVARAKGVPISLDPNLRLSLWSAEEARSVLLQAMESGIDLLLPNIDEARMLFGNLSPEQLIEAAHRAGARLVALKMGDQGAWLSDGTTVTIQPPWTGMPVVDPVGAGDSFAGGLIVGLLKGLSLAEAGRLGAFCGARAVAGVGDWEAAPTWEEALAAKAVMPVEGRCQP